MGTNYYLIPHEPCEHCHRGYEAIHIGKSSMGWVFDFRGYIDGATVFEQEIRTVADWHQAIKVADHQGGWIENEYGEHIDPGEFWQRVDAKRQSKSREGVYFGQAGDNWVDDGCDFSAYEFC